MYFELFVSRHLFRKALHAHVQKNSPKFINAFSKLQKSIELNEECKLIVDTVIDCATLVSTSKSKKEMFFQLGIMLMLLLPLFDTELDIELVIMDLKVI